jgi:hypothetical protein
MSTKEYTIASTRSRRTRRTDPAARQATDRHYLAVIAAEIHRLALALRATPRPRPTTDRHPRLDQECGELDSE